MDGGGRHFGRLHTVPSLIADTGNEPGENTSFFLSVNMISYLLYQIALRIRDSPASLPSSGKKQERNRYKRKSMEYTFTELFWLLLVYSFIGWVIEAMVGSIKNKRFTNRGFSTAPSVSSTELQL